MKKAATVYNHTGMIVANFYSESKKELQKYMANMAPLRPTWERVRYGRYVYTMADLLSDKRGELASC